MKRSEIIKLIMNAITVGEHEQPLETRAHNLLAIIETAGMLPASFYYFDDKFVSSKQAIEDHDMYGSFQWEPEDEKN